jgi:hypothetical protein
MIFVNSMSDLFHPDVPDSFIMQVARRCDLPDGTRSLAPSLTGYKERMARTVVSKLLDAGLLVCPSHVARLRLGFPLPVVERWFPALYPSASYRFYA